MNNSVNIWQVDRATICEFSLQGIKHQKKGMPCQDACISCTTPNQWVLIAVSDGVSSSPQSERASAEAVAGLKDFWNDYASPYTGKDEMQAALQTSFNYALSRSKDAAQSVPGGLETTLTAVLISPQRHLFGMHVGDGGVWILENDHSAKCLTRCMRDQEGCVAPLSKGPDYWDFFEADCSGINGLLVVTDGVQELLMSENGSNASAILKYGLSQVKNCKASFEADPDFWKTEDDITVSSMIFDDFLLQGSDDPNKNMGSDDPNKNQSSDGPDTNQTAENPGLEKEKKKSGLSRLILLSAILILLIILSVLVLYAPKKQNHQTEEPVEVQQTEATTAETDAEGNRDAGADSDAGLVPDAGAETDTDENSDTGSDPDTVEKSDTGTVPDAGTDPDTDVNTNAGTDPDAKPVSDVGADSNAEPASNAGADRDAGVTSGAEANSNTETDPDTEVIPDAGSDPVAEGEQVIISDNDVAEKEQGK